MIKALFPFLFVDKHSLHEEFLFQKSKQFQCFKIINTCFSSTEGLIFEIKNDLLFESKNQN